MSKARSSSVCVPEHEPHRWLLNATNFCLCYLTGPCIAADFSIYTVPSSTHGTQTSFTTPELHQSISARIAFAGPECWKPNVIWHKLKHFSLVFACGLRRCFDCGRSCCHLLHTAQKVAAEPAGGRAGKGELGGRCFQLLLF